MIGENMSDTGQAYSEWRQPPAVTHPSPAVLAPVDVARDALNAIEGVRVFVTTRERIKHPEGTDLFDESVRSLRAAVEQMAADLAAAQREAAIAQAEAATWRNDWHAAMDRVDTLRQRAEAASQNERRYLYLRDNCKREWVSDMPHNKGAPSLDIEFEAAGHDLDAAIDAAMQEPRPHE